MGDLEGPAWPPGPAAAVEVAKVWSVDCWSRVVERAMVDVYEPAAAGATAFSIPLGYDGTDGFGVV